MNRINLLPSVPLFSTPRTNWPPPPKVKGYDSNGIEIPRPQDSPEIAELKRDKAIYLFEGLNTTKMAESMSTVELERAEASEVSGPLSLNPSRKGFEMTRPSYQSVEYSMTKMLAVESAGGSGDNSEGGQPTLTKTKNRKKRNLEKVFKMKKKGVAKQIPRMSRLALGEYLKNWDKGSNFQRVALIHKFVEDYTSQDPLDLDLYLSKGGSLIFTRFIVGMQISFQCKKPVAHHFLALGIFIKSLDGERYTHEFGLAGGFQTSFEVLRVHEMTNHDKMHDFHFLFSVIDGKGGSSTKRFLCNDTSYLECVVDCLTMCQNEHVIKEAKQFLRSLCLGNTSKNLGMISKYVISLLPCDFNPQIQAMACDVLQGIINQNPEVAASCCTLVVDVLKSNFNDALVDVGNVCLAIMGTPTADELLFHLIEAAQPYNLLENLSTQGVISQVVDTIGFEDLESTKGEEEHEEHSLETDPYFRLQYGAIYVLSYMVKNQTETVDWMIERGVIGSLLSGIGTPCYTSVQLEAIRLLLLIHELSPDCALALPSLLPEKLLTTLLTEHEEVLQHVTAVMCLVLRRLGARVQENWTAWFTQVGSPGEGRKVSISQYKSEEESGEGEEDVDDERNYDALYEIDVLVELLEKSLTTPFTTIVESMKLIFPDPSIIEAYRDGTQPQSSQMFLSHQPTMQRFHEKMSIGEEHIQETEALEPFRKYLRKSNVIVEKEDEFQKYYAAKFIMASEAHSVDLDAMQVAALQDAEKAMKTFKDPFKIEEGTVTTEKKPAEDEFGLVFDDATTNSGQDQMLNL